MQFHRWAIFQETWNSPIVMHLVKKLDNHSDTIQLVIFTNLHWKSLGELSDFALRFLTRVWISYASVGARNKEFLVNRRRGESPLLDITSGIFVQNQSKIFPWQAVSHIKWCSPNEDRTRHTHDCWCRCLYGDQSKSPTTSDKSVFDKAVEADQNESQ